MVIADVILFVQESRVRGCRRVDRDVQTQHIFFELDAEISLGRTGEICLERQTVRSLVDVDRWYGLLVLWNRNREPRALPLDDEVSELGDPRGTWFKGQPFRCCLRTGTNRDRLAVDRQRDLIAVPHELHVMPGFPCLGWGDGGQLMVLLRPEGVAQRMTDHPHLREIQRRRQDVDRKHVLGGECHGHDVRDNLAVF